MAKTLKFITALAALLAFGLVGAGCGPGESLGLGAEVDDAGYREGQQLVRQGRPQEALVAYLKVIGRRPDAAPESHLEVGLIYKQHMKDPVAAIYHFRKYLEMQPNARQAKFVRDQIEAAKRDFGRSLAAQPLESREVRVEGFEIDRLQRENEQLKAELAVLRASGGTGVAVPTPRAPVADNREVRPTPTAEDDASPITLAPIQPRDPEPAPMVQTAPTSAGSGARSKPVAPNPGSGRRHTVAAKDSLYAIAKKYYGTATNAKVQGIIEANRDLLPAGAGTPLKAGMELRIP